MPQAPSTRWCPTPEQLMILEEMYKSGVRTPNAPQIQQITAHLSHYGKIEGKNVFYWFQNHKARDRQKLRRRLISCRYHGQQYMLQQHQMDFPPPPPQFHPLEAVPAASYSPVVVLHPHQIFHQISTDQYFLQQGCHQMEGTEAMNLISKLEASELGEEDDRERPVQATCPASYGCGEKVSTVLSEARPPVPPCRRPARTLDLFPTRSTGLIRELEGSTSNSISH